MFGKRFSLFTIFGFEVKADLSWLVIAALVTWSLAAGAFPLYYPDLSQGTYWAMGVVGAILLFASILAHELTHSLVGRRFGIEIKGITLWIFGGIAETGAEAERPREELLMAGAGPLSSLVLAGVFWGLTFAGSAFAWPAPVMGVLGYLAWVNFVLALFNLVPAFPLDGGRVLRAFLWGRKGNILDATRVASKVGSGFGILLIGLGVVGLFFGNFIGGVWWILIGMFLRGAARGTYQQLVASKILEGAPVRRMMDRHPATVSRGTPLDRFVNDYVYSKAGRLFPVTDGGQVVGFIDARSVGRVPRGEWEQHTVDELVQSLSSEAVIRPDVDAAEALRRLQESGRGSLLVTDDGHLEGVVSLEDLQRYLAVKADLERTGHGTDART